MQTRKYPRTMNEAFGPYASGPIHEMRDTRRGYSWGWYAAVVVFACIAVAVNIGLR